MSGNTIIKRIAEETSPEIQGDYSSYCFYCSAGYIAPHAADCIWAECRRLMGLPVPETVGGPRFVPTGRLVQRETL